MSIFLLNLKDANPQQLEEFSKITNNLETMKFVQKGTLWSKNYINELYKNSIYDDKIEKRYFHWLVIHHETVVGYVGIRPLSKNYGMGNDEFQDRIIISPQGRGYGTIATHLLIENYPLNKRFLWSVIDYNNIASIKLKEKMGWKFVKSKNLFGVKSYFYVREMI